MKKNSIKADDKKHIHVVLFPDRFEKFSTIKKQLRQNTDVDVVRFCIDEVYEKLNNNRAVIKPILERQINEILKNEYLKNRYLLEDYNGIINDSISLWIQSKRSEINLYHLPFKVSLDKEEQLVADVFLESHYEKNQGITVEDITQQIPSLNCKQINTILQSFIKGGLITVNRKKGIDYYFAILP